MIRETKATKDQMQLRGFENAKIKCGARHFGTPIKRETHGFPVYTTSFTLSSWQAD
jgi:restriction endonuclease